MSAVTRGGGSEENWRSAKPAKRKSGKEQDILSWEKGRREGQEGLHTLAKLKDAREDASD